MSCFLLKSQWIPRIDMNQMGNRKKILTPLVIQMKTEQRNFWNHNNNGSNFISEFFSLFINLFIEKQSWLHVCIFLIYYRFAERTPYKQMTLIEKSQPLEIKSKQIENNDKTQVQWMSQLNRHATMTRFFLSFKCKQLNHDVEVDDDDVRWFIVWLGTCFKFTIDINIM